MADVLATLAAMFKVNANVKIQLVKLRVQKFPAHCACVDEKVDGKPWYFDILQYVKSQQYPGHATENDKKTLKRLAMGFLLDGESCTRKVETKCY